MDKASGEFRIEKARAGDFERVYPLLKGFGIESLTKEHWKRIFVNRWQAPEDFCGYLLLKDGEVKGFLGLILSRRYLGGRVQKFCNMTSWIVDEDSRSQSLRLLLETLKLKDHVITNFTPSKSVAAILKKLGFTEIETHQRVLLPLPALSRSHVRLQMGEDQIRRALSPADLRIFEDHLELDCEHVLLAGEGEYCYLVLKRIRRRHLPFAKAHYVSNPELLARAGGRVTLGICRRLKVAGLMIDERYLKGHALKRSRRFQQECAAFYKPAAVGPCEVDSLYSEMILLHQ